MEKRGTLLTHSDTCTDEYSKYILSLSLSLSLKDPCENNPCQNGGTCHAIYHKGEYKCNCRGDYCGVQCESK